MSFSDLETELKKKKYDQLYDEEDDIPQVKKQRASATEKKPDPKKSPYDLILVEDGTTNKLIPPYAVYIGKGVALEIKEYRKLHYLCFSKTVEGDIKNRLNLPVDQVTTLKKAIDAISLYLKDYM